MNYRGYNIISGFGLFFIVELGGHYKSIAECKKQIDKTIIQNNIEERQL